MSGAPSKIGIDYFPFQIGLLSDRKLRRVKMRYGAMGVLTYLALLEMAYGDKGYYLDYSDESRDGVIWDVMTILQGMHTPKTEIVQEVIALLVECGLFDGDQFSNKTLTSKRMQMNYYRITAERKAMNIDFEKWILSEKDMRAISSKSSILHNFINLTDNSINRTNNSIHQPINTTKESKVKESKVKESVGGRTLTDEEFSELCTRYDKKIVIDYVKRTLAYKCCTKEKIIEWIEEDRSKGKNKTKGNNFESRKYDMTDLEKKLLQNK